MFAARVGRRPSRTRRPTCAGRSRSSSAREADGLTDAWTGAGRHRGLAPDAGRRGQPQRVDHRRGPACTRPAASAAPDRGRLRAMPSAPWRHAASTSSSSAPARPARPRVHKARALGASVAVVDRRWFGGSCPHIGCVPSKSLLHAADAHAKGGDYPWSRASAAARLHGQPARRRRRARRREPRQGARGRTARSSTAATARIAGRGRRRRDPRRRRPTSSRRANVVVAVGSTSKVPPIEGLADVQPWTNREATLARELPRSLLVLGGGPTGCELAQVYARFGVPVTIVQSGPRLVPTEHPRNAEAIRWALERDGVTRAARACARCGRARAPGRTART